MAGRRILTERINGFTRDGLGRVHFGGLVAIRSRPVGSDESGPRVGGSGRERDGSASQICFLKFQKSL
jgi:hypothetical protein